MYYMYYFKGKFNIYFIYVNIIYYSQNTHAMLMNHSYLFIFYTDLGIQNAALWFQDKKNSLHSKM